MYLVFNIRYIYFFLEKFRFYVWDIYFQDVLDFQEIYFDRNNVS